MNSSDYNSLIEKLPHKGKMLLIDAVLSVDAETARTETYFDARREWIQAPGGRVEAYLGVELIAQSAALPLIFASKAGERHAGMIVQVKSFDAFGVVLPSHPTLTTECRIERLLDGTVGLVTGTVRYEQTLVCEAVLTLSIQSIVL